MANDNAKSSGPANGDSVLGVEENLQVEAKGNIVRPMSAGQKQRTCSLALVVRVLGERRSLVKI